MAASQHRRVFVGNIPYDATEEQLIQICEEVGPVVSFRLVVDRETGKPKGYGFCEYKDEETALSARRNLQGYEINGRQLRVDFAENDKGSERNHLNKQVGGPAVALDATLNQQAGLQLATTAASVMTGALGGPQAAGPSNSNGPQQQTLLGNDPLTVHLAKMSKSQLIQVMSEMKVLATENYDLARQLLGVCPQLPKALFQAQIMLGMVTPQMMPNIRQASAQGNHQSQQSAPTNIHGLPPMVPLTSAPQSSLISNQHSVSMQFPTQVRPQAPNLAHIGSSQENPNVIHTAANTLPSSRPQHFGGMSSGPPITGSMSMRPVQSPLLHNSRLSGPGSSGHGIQPSVSGGSMLPGSGFQTGPLVRPATLETSRNAVVGRMNPTPSSSLSSRNDSLELSGRPSKLVKLEDGRASSFSGGDFPVSTTSNNKLPNSAGIGAKTATKRSRADEPQNLETQAPQLQLPPALIQQLKNLTPEQLSKLSPEEQQQAV
ncbi:hypothetical protein V2J09_001497 [Rumex salicifolius]